MSEYVLPDPLTPLGNVRNSRLYESGSNSFTKIYCHCGRIVDIDSKDYLRKIALRKPVECAFCRNARIARELDSLDSHYNVIEESEIF